MKYTLPLLALSLTTVSAALTAQGDNRGVMASWAQGLNVNGSTEVVRKEAGDQASPPDAFPVPGPGSPLIPVFRVEALFGPGHLVAIDGMATGSDFLPISYGGTSEEYPDGFCIADPGAGPLGWAAITVSLSGATPAPSAEPGSVLAQRLAITGGSIGGDLYSYWFAGNALPPQFVNRAYFVAGQEHTGLAAEQDIDAHDIYMPPILEAGGVASGWLRRVDTWYFSITPESADWIRTQWDAPTNLEDLFVGSVTETMVQAASVFKVQWSNGAWGLIDVAHTPQAMGLSNDDDIDALAYFDGPSVLSSGSQAVIFSLRGLSSGTAQILAAIIDPGIAPGPFPLVTLNGDSILEPIGVREASGDVDSLCVTDPHVPHPDHYLAGPFHYVAHAGFPGAIGASATRYTDKSGTDRLKLKAVSLPAAAGLLTWLLTFSTGAPQIVRLPARGQPTIEHDIVLLNLPVGTDISMQAFFVPSGSGVPASSYPVKLQL